MDGTSDERLIEQVQNNCLKGYVKLLNVSRKIDDRTITAHSG
jgi:hypothetical protein